MLNSLFRKLMAPKLIPIGVDLGSDWLRLAQVEVTPAGAVLLAAAEMQIPAAARADDRSRLSFTAEGLRQLLAQGFQGRQVVLGLSPSLLYAQHLRLPKMDEKELRKAIPWETRGKLPVEPQHAMLRYVVAGDAYREREPGQEVVILASRKDLVAHYLKVAERARLDVVGMEPDPLTIAGCLGPIYAEADPPPVVLLVDMGRQSARAIIVRGSQVKLVRFVNIGAERLGQAEAMPSSELSGPTTDDASQGTATAVASSTERALDTLVSELELCRRYYEATFPEQPIERLVFVGGGALQREWCQYVARQLNIAAQVGDPLQRLTKAEGVTSVGAVDLQQAQPTWTVAIGLSLKAQEKAQSLAKQ